MSFSPDGKRLASGSWDGTVKVWDAVTGSEVLTLKGHTNYVRSVCFSPDGKRLASASGDKTVRVWDAATGQELLTLTGHTGGIGSVSFSPDGRRLAGVGTDRTVKVWDTATDTGVLALKGHTGAVASIAFSPDGKRLASGSQDKTVKVWDTATRQVIRTLTGHTSSVTGVAFSPDGKRLAAGSGDFLSTEPSELKVWDAATGRELLTLKGHAGRFYGLAFSPDGKTLWSRDGYGRVKGWNAHSGKQLDNPGRAPLFPPSDARHPSAPLLALPEGDTILLIDVSPPDADELAFRKAKARFDPFWHEEQAAEAEKTGDGFAAAFHLGKLLSSRPWDPDLLVRRAYAFARLSRAEPAARHYLQAILLNPRIRLWPLDPQAAARGNAAAQAGDWPRAAEAFRLAAHQPGAVPAIWEGLLLALRSSRQDAACPQVIHAMLDHFTDRRDVLTTRSLLFYSLVATCDEADARRLIQVATRLVAGQRNATHLVWLGAALYRANRYEDAIKALQESIKMHGKGGYADSWLFLAMAHQRLGHAGQARQWFAKAESWFRAQHFGTWQHRLRWQLLRGEANALVNPPPRMPHASDGD